MAKLALKAQPTFPAKVAIPVPGGAPVEVEFTFKHRTRAELEAYLAELREPKVEAKGKAKADAVSDEVKAVMNVAVGWENDEPFTAENVGVFLENYHKSAWCIGTSYITELMQAREGN